MWWCDGNSLSKWNLTSGAWKRLFFAPFHTKKDDFTKTGSGQT